VPPEGGASTAPAGEGAGTGDGTAAGPARPGPPDHEKPPDGAPRSSDAPEPALATEDHLERRIRRPIDLLRLVVGCAAAVVLAGAGLVAHATATGVATDIATAGHRLPGALLALLGLAATLALIVLPVALAGRQLARGESRRLGEAVFTAAITLAVITAVNALLRLPRAAHLYSALAVTRGGLAVTVPLDAYLAALAAYVTVIGLSGRPRWRDAVLVSLLVYCVANLVAGHTTVLSLLITLVLGRTIGVGIRYAAGQPSQRPPAAEIAEAIGSQGIPLAAMRRIPEMHPVTRLYAATARDGSRLDITVFDRDQEAADALYRFYRGLRLARQIARTGPLSQERALERRALLSYAAADAQVRTPRLRAFVRVGPDAIVLAYTHEDGVTLDGLPGGPADMQLRRVWQTVLRLHSHRVTHRALTADRILITGDGEVVLLDPGNGDVAASELQMRLDVAQLLAELALHVGPERAADVALGEVGAARLAGAVPLLQPLALYRSTRGAVRRRPDLLPALRARLLAALPNGGQVARVQLERVRLRTLLSLVAGVAAAYVLAGQLARVNLIRVVRHADWRWTLIALVVSALTYAAAATSLSGFVLERLAFVRTLLAQVAASFVTLVTPAAVGGAALNIRYLQRSGVSPARATASVGAAQVVAFLLHMLLLVIFAALTGTLHIHSLTPPTWAYAALAGLLVLVLAAIAIPPGRRLLRARLTPALGQVLPRLLDLAQNPRKLAAGFAGALALTALYVFCLAACVRALGGSVPLVGVAVVYLTGSAIGSAAPTPGGLGAVEVALSAGLTAAGLQSATALSAVLLFRLLTFWLPVPAGWVAFNYLERREAL
jgi:glycosyltransferase 2 family protein